MTSKRNKGKKPKRDKRPGAIMQLSAQTEGPIFRVRKPRISIPKDRIWVPPLTWTAPIRNEPYSPEIIEWLVDHCRTHEAKWFCDANCYIGKTEDCFWEYVVEKKGRLQTIPEIVHELRHWIEEPSHNLLIHPHFVNCVNGCDSSITVCRHDDDQILYAKNHYLNLLALRQYSDMFADCHYSTKGIHASQSKINDFIINAYGRRTFELTKKATDPTSNNAGNKTYPDGALVLAAIFEAVTTGTDCYIFTHDEDVLDQFYKAIWIIDTNYHSMLAAQIFKRDKRAFGEVKYTKELKNTDFKDGLMLLDKPSNTMREFRPNTLNQCNCYCTLIKNLKIHMMHFTVVREWEALFRVKARTRGLSTDLFNDRNCHVDIGIHQAVLGDNPIVIGFDNFFPPLEDKGFRIPMLDVQHAIMQHERHSGFFVV